MSAVLAVSVTTASSESVPRPLATGATVTEPGRGTVQTAGKLAVEAGKNVVVQKITLEPGKSIAWHAQPENAVVIMTKGTLSNYVSCSEKQTWGAGNTYSLSGQNASTTTKNDGTEPAEFVAIFSPVAADQAAGSVPISYTDAPAGCPAVADSVKVEELGRGVAYNGAQYELMPNTNVVVEHFVVEPGFTTTWHRHPATQIIVQLKGETANYLDCEKKEIWKPGVAYVHLNSEHHNASPYLTRNESDAPSTFIVIFFNVPNDVKSQPGLTPISPFSPPPSDCPTMLY
jgi:quercetin dioxygenase-like cupin family protein